MNSPRGSEWRKWDLHFHTPSSYDYKNKTVTNQDIIDTLSENGISVVAITDHHIIDIDRIKELQELGKEKNITVLPGIEFLSDARGREPIHFIGIFAEDSNLEYIWGQIENRTEINKIKGELKNFNEIYCHLTNTIKIIEELGGIVSIHSGGKSNSIENITHSLPHTSSQKADIAHHVHIFELGNENDQEGYRKIVFPTIQKVITMIICSDNHNINYYKLKQNCWIKADPTFEGLRQIIYEPEERVFIGELPELLYRFTENRIKFVTNLNITQNDDYDNSRGVWFQDINISFNQGMVAIIGNKGSGKSAITDILGLCGNSHHYKDFSFLKSDRFLKNGLANNFKASLTWASGEIVSKKLSENIDENAPERIRYLPQSFFERLTNNLESYDFKKTLEDIVFSYLPEEERLGRKSFDELITFRRESIEKDIKLIINEIQNINRELIGLEIKLHPSYLDKLEKELKIKNKELEEHLKNKPLEVKNPDLDEEAREANKQISLDIQRKNTELDKLNSEKRNIEARKISLKKESAELDNLEEDFQRFKNEIENFISQNKGRLTKFGLDINDIFTYRFNLNPIKERKKEKEKEYIEISKKLLSIDEINQMTCLPEEEKRLEKASVVVILNNIKKELRKLREKLSKPFQEYQMYLEDLKKWNDKKEELEGDKDKPNTIKWYQAEIDYVKGTLSDFVKIKRAERINNVIEIYKKKQELMSIYKKLKESIDNQIKNYKSILEDYDINIDVTLKLKSSFVDEFLYFVNQNKKGSFYQIDAGKYRVEKMISLSDLQSEEGIKKFLDEIIDTLEHDNRDEFKGERRYISDQINSDKLFDFYNYLFSLSYLEPSYELKLGEKLLTELSPGEKGAMLIVFYLMLDQENIPLVVDQPEENLDNESIYKILVHFIRQAKRRRQVIIVTHNPNLAIVGDAEQIIYVTIDKKNRNTFSFKSGAIENPIINKHASDILEGTLKAFDVRRLKYFRGNST